MYEIIPTSTWKKVLLIVFVVCTIILMVSYYDYTKLLNYQVLFSASDNDSMENKAEPYLVSSLKCKIVNLDPFSSDAKRYFRPLKYKSCTKHALLSYVTKEDNIATVHIDSEILPRYTDKKVTCCFSNVVRKTPGKNPDDFIKLSDCKVFHDNVTITTEAILVRCSEKISRKKIYENVHTSVRITKDVQKKISNYDNSTKPLSILFIGIDSISRLNFIRALPNTYKFVTEKGWNTLKGYNKMDDNTFPNIMAILTGFNQTHAYNVCKPKSVGFMDKCPMLWYDYRKLGYITSYAEDEATIGTFNYNKKGFVKPPTDYYFRPYIMATEKLPKVSVSYMNYCTGPETAGERILNVIKDFATTFIDHPNFGVFWMNTFTHNEINTASMMDNKLTDILTDLDNSGVTNNSMVVFLSDHGIRFGDIRLTETGWLEERLPFIYFSFPPWFKEKFSAKYDNFKSNVNKLTTPYDLYMTFQDILIISGFNYSIKPSDACPKCKSLFEKVDTERSCEDASIEQHWCTCAGYTETKLDPEIEAKLSNFVLDKLYKITSNVSRGGGDNKCAKYSKEHISTRISHRFSYQNSSYVLVTLKTNPKAVFEMTIRYEGDIRNGNFSPGDISRLDYYSGHSRCVNDAQLKKYCYCR